MKRILFFSIFTCVLVFQTLLNAQTTYTLIANGGDAVNNTLLFTEASVITITENPVHRRHICMKAPI
ncbi:MAG: hypothetical protein KBE38_10440 [Ignavibacterium sp.]|nr:hypothetical protein [Ignavibacterium sp.]